MARAERADNAELPENRAELHRWIQERLHLSAAQQSALLHAIDTVFSRHERLWQQSKDDAIQAMAAGFAERMARLKTELSARDATVSSIARYFEDLVAELTDKVHRDPKTRLMNFRRFVEQLEAFLALEQRGRWCAVGLVDIAGFKWYNDALGHALGDRIIDRVARLLREQIRSDDLIAQERRDGRSPDLHARLGGDEFCFLIPDLADYSVAWMIAERFREAVERYDWESEDLRLAAQPVRVDVGVVCVWLGPVAARRSHARRLAHDLIARADKLMYEAKGERASHIFPIRVKIVEGQLIDIAKDEHVGEDKATAGDATPPVVSRSPGA